MRIGSVISTADVLIQDVPGLFQLGCFCMTELSAESFLHDFGSNYILDVLENYKYSCELEYNALLGQICNLFLHLVQGIYALCPQRSSANGPISGYAPPAMPWNVAESVKFMFITAIITQKDRLRATFTEEKIFKTFERNINYLR